MIRERTEMKIKINAKDIHMELVRERPCPTTEKSALGFRV